MRGSRGTSSSRSAACRAGIFVVQEHQATARHFDLRLEVDGVMRSWAVPKGPSLDPAQKRMAIEVADHDIGHNDVEGPLGDGGVIVWDRGVYEQGGRVPWPEALERGHAVFVLHGEKLRGGFALQRTRPDGGRPQWLLIKRKDDDARPGSRRRHRAARVGGERADARRRASGLSRAALGLGARRHPHPRAGGSRVALARMENRPESWSEIVEIALIAASVIEVSGPADPRIIYSVGQTLDFCG